MPAKRKQAKRPPRGLTLKISPRERDALRRLRLDGPVERKLETGEASTRFTYREIDVLLTAIVNEPGFNRERSFLAPLRQQVIEAIEECNPDAFGIEHLREVAESSGAKDLFFQFRVTIMNTEPAVWRRIQVADGPLTKLHEAIQGSFAWYDGHLHEFDIYGVRFAPPPEFDDPYMPQEDENRVFISQLLPRSGKQAAWKYTYDFGDNWEHQVVFEGCGPRDKRTKYPLCLEGERAGPPEDCGGVWGYAEILALLAGEETDSDDGEARLEWLGPFDPAAFDPAETTKRMQSFSSAW